jgi:hypothetical protein
VVNCTSESNNTSSNKKMCPKIFDFQVRALLTCCNLTNKAPGEHRYPHCTAVRQIAYRTVVLHIISFETSYANRALDVHQMALVTFTFEHHQLPCTVLSSTAVPVTLFSVSIRTSDRSQTLPANQPSHTGRKTVQLDGYCD